MANPKYSEVEQTLAHHLKEAEGHLIAAINLFSLKNAPERPLGFLERLSKAQEITTALRREELVRMRGPLKAARKAAKIAPKRKKAA